MSNLLDSIGLVIFLIAIIIFIVFVVIIIASLYVVIVPFALLAGIVVLILEFYYKRR